MADRSYLVAGLGNIGPEYAATRHNIGFIVLDAWAQASNLTFDVKRYGALLTDTVKGRQVHRLKPSTYMNLTGGALRCWMNELAILPENLIVVCDDINLPFGTTRMRLRGSDGGHNGLRNIEEMLQTRDYARIRIGVGHDFAEGDQIDFFLGHFSLDQLPQLPQIADRVINGIKTWAFAGAQKAMSDLNAKAPAAENTPNQ